MPLRLIVAAAALALFAACDSVEYEDSDAGADASGSVCVAGATQLCACGGGAQGAQVCEAGGTGFGACDCSTPPAVGDVTIELLDANGATVPAIDESHTVGTTDCVQPLATIVVTNDTDAAATTEFATSPSVATVVFTPASPVEVAAGASVGVVVTFDCSRLTANPEDFDTTVTVTPAGGGDGISFPLGLSFIFPSGS